MLAVALVAFSPLLAALLLAAKDERTRQERPTRVGSRAGYLTDGCQSRRGQSPAATAHRTTDTAARCNGRPVNPRRL